MSYFALIIAVILETLLPDRLFDRSRVGVDHLTREFEIDLVKLGVASAAHLQWLAPVVVWTLGVYFLNKVLLGTWPLLAGVVSITIILYGLRFKHFAEVYTTAQLFLNQGDFFRARELFLNWMKEYDGSEVHVQRADELVVSAVYHGSERALRQYFAVIFWYLVVPGPTGLVMYMAVHWSVVRERQLWIEQAHLQEMPSLGDLWDAQGKRALMSPRFVLYLMEWVPARLLGLTVALVSQFDEVMLAWRTAQTQSRFSNWAPLTAACLAAVGLSSGLGSGSESGLSGSDDAPVQALQQFRQLILKCVVAWLSLGLLLALLGWMPNPFHA
ncbi:regulatory signaling modulator protein AmpE [Limnobacter humi]|uniref:Regulatory signaling modulator protein AmpE n=1 Tax=Limnobacter humi TaxID=1778671 RepID=A0ABT1WHK7_9BURK|nr:regulatory signaling modulator protein AmpE [Limnobacter humi]MCQ8896894.1 regulatory signaling modulator protein AmpE [Limnobacter humi]